MRGISEHSLDHTTSARRCLLAIAVCTPLVVLILVVNQFALAEPTIRVGLRESVFWALQATLFVGLLIGLALAQEDLAQLLGASRQRVNQELKGFEREGAVRVEPTRLVVLSRDKLMALADK